MALAEVGLLRHDGGGRWLGACGGGNTLSGGCSLLHAPNSFVENVQTDGNPGGSTAAFDAIILDGRTGFGNATGTARVVRNSTFTPGRAGTSPNIIGALVTGANAVPDFLDDHFELTSGDDCIQVVNGANVSAQGATQDCNPFIHLYSAFTSPFGASGNDIGVRNVTTLPGDAVVQDDVNSVVLKTHVSDYSTLTPPDNDPQISSHTVHLRDDFMGGTTATGNVGELGWSFASGSVAKLAGQLNHLGIFQRSTSAAGTVATTLLASATNPIFSLAGVPWHATFILLNDSSGTNSTTNVTIRVGLSSNAIGTPPAEGYYFENVSGASAQAWIGVNRTGGAQSVATSTVNLDNSWHRFEITNYYDGVNNNVNYYIDGNLVSGSPVTGHISSSTMVPFFYIINTNSVTENKILDIDAFDFWMEVTR